MRRKRKPTTQNGRNKSEANVTTFRTVKPATTYGKIFEGPRDLVRTQLYNFIMDPSKTVLNVRETVDERNQLSVIVEYY